MQRAFSSTFSKHIYSLFRPQPPILCRSITYLPPVACRREALPPTLCYPRLSKVKTRTGMTTYWLMPHVCQSKRNFAWWKIPLALMKTGKKQKALALISAVGGTTLLGFFFGPLSFLIVSTLFGGLAWRIWRQTSKWWQYLPLNNNPIDTASLYSMVRTLVGQHRAEDNVRNLAIQRIKQWANTEEGRSALLYDFNVSHADDLTFLPTHARATYTTVKSAVDAQTSKENTTTHKEVDIQFLIEANGGDEGGCMVDTKALIDGDTGDIALKNIRLSSPGWIMDKYVPLDDQHNKSKFRVIEGEFKDV